MTHQRLSMQKQHCRKEDQDCFCDFSLWESDSGAYSNMKTCKIYIMRYRSLSMWAKAALGLLRGLFFLCDI